jgi:hypothetical protein
MIGFGRVDGKGLNRSLPDGRLCGLDGEDNSPGKRRRREYNPMFIPAVARKGIVIAVLPVELTTERKDGSWIESARAICFIMACATLGFYGQGSALAP